MFDNSDDYEHIQKHIPLKDLPAFAIFKLNKSTKTEQLVSYFVIILLTQKVLGQGEIFLEWAAKSMGIVLKRRENLLVEQ